jgi:hypothetical protein
MKVTYLPQDGDPIRTTWNGFAFEANKATEIPDDAFVNALVKQEFVDEKTGIVTSLAREGKITMLSLVKGNPSFQIEGSEPAQRKAGRPSMPKTSDQYRSYALAWFARMETPQELGERWQDEAGLRERLGIHEGGDDIAYLRPFYEARHYELTKALAAA